MTKENQDLYNKIVSTFKEGEVIPTYAEFCKRLDIKPSTKTNLRKKHLDSLKWCIDFSRKGQKIIINKIYNPDEVKYNKLIQAIYDTVPYTLLCVLENYYKETGKQTLYFTTEDLGSTMGYINSKYTMAKKDPTHYSISIEDEILREETNKDYIKDYQEKVKSNRDRQTREQKGQKKDYIRILPYYVTEENVNRFIDTIYKNFSNRIKNVLSSLDNSKIIIDRKVYIAEFFYYDENGNKITFEEELETQAIESYTVIEAKIRKELDCANYYEVLNKHKEVEYEAKLKSYLRKLNIDHVYQVNAISFAGDFLEDSKKYYKKEVEKKKSVKDFQAEFSIDNLRKVDFQDEEKQLQSHKELNQDFYNDTQKNIKNSIKNRKPQSNHTMPNGRIIPEYKQDFELRKKQDGYIQSKLADDLILRDNFEITDYSKGTYRTELEKTAKHLSSIFESIERDDEENSENRIFYIEQFFLGNLNKFIEGFFN